MPVIDAIKFALQLVFLVGTIGCSQQLADQPPMNVAQAPQAENIPQNKVDVADVEHHQQTIVATRIIRTGYVSVTVTDLAPLQVKVSQLARNAGALIADSDLQTQTQSRRRCVWKLRVPSEKFDDLLPELCQLGHLQSTRSTAQDVSEECVDITARIHNKRVEVDRLLKLFESASATLTQVGDVQREFSRAQEELERLQGRQRWLEVNTSYSTIHFTVDELAPYVPPTTPEPSPFREQIAQTWNSSCNALVEAARFSALFVTALAPWVGLLAFVFVPFHLLRNLKRQQSPSTPA